MTEHTTDTSNPASVPSEPSPEAAAQAIAEAAAALPPEVGGTAGPEPTRYGDWAHKGRVSDF